MKNKQGISLIVLVITIIVMIILAGAIVLTLNNSGIIDKASEAVDETNIATIKEMANVAWSEAYLNGKKADKDFEEYVKAALTKNGIEEKDYEGYILEITKSGIELFEGISHYGIIPDGGVYIKGATWDEANWETNYDNATYYNSGENFPKLEVGDIYRFGDYEYGYKIGLDYGDWDSGWAYITPTAWDVTVTDRNKTSYGEILTKINGDYIEDMTTTFANCTSLTYSPKIPSSVKTMIYTYDGCTSLITMPGLPSRVENLDATFIYCKSLVDLSSCEIPTNVTSMSVTFEGCTSLEKPPTIEHLTKLKNITSIFSECRSLVDMSNYVIPESVTSMTNSFGNCMSLKQAPKIPSNVTEMLDAFCYCTSLTGDVVINSNNITSYDNCFTGTTLPITLIGTGSNNNILNSLAATAESGNVTVK